MYRLCRKAGFKRGELNGLCSVSSSIFTGQSVRAQVRDPIPLHGKVKHGVVWWGECSRKQLGEVSPKIFNFFFSHSCGIPLQSQGIESFEKEREHTNHRGHGPSLFMFIGESGRKMQHVHELIFQI